MCTILPPNAPASFGSPPQRPNSIHAADHLGGVHCGKRWQPRGIAGVLAHLRGRGRSCPCGQRNGTKAEHQGSRTLAGPTVELSFNSRVLVGAAKPYGPYTMPNLSSYFRKPEFVSRLYAYPVASYSGFMGFSTSAAAQGGACRDHLSRGESGRRFEPPDPGSLSTRGSELTISSRAGGRWNVCHFAPGSRPRNALTIHVFAFIIHEVLSSS